MRIAVTRTGGFAGITRRAELDTAGRPDADRLHDLARDALADHAAAPGAPAVPDGFVYEVTVDGETFRCADPRLTDAQRALVRAVLDGGGTG
jgi:hypothetical protein